MTKKNSQAHKLMGLKDPFKFRCHRGLQCFTSCCADVTIYLTPYDSLRLSQALNLTSTRFLAEYTGALRGRRPIIPLIYLKMREDAGLACPLVSPEGCRVYHARPWSCRMFPLDLIGRQDFQVMSHADFCLGLKETDTRPVIDYLVDQGVTLSAELDSLYQEITDHPQMDDMDVDNPKIAEMVHLACYDLDRFREFVFGSTFLERFDIPEERLALVRESQVELLKLGYDWVRFGLFAEKTLALRPAALEKARRDQAPS